MFHRLQDNPTINGIMCVPYSNLIYNDNTRQFCIDQSFLNAECDKIQEWVFDVSLNNKQLLYHIF